MPNGADITDGLISGFANTRFSGAREIDLYFQNQAGQRYIKWFNSTLADQGLWKGVRLVDTSPNDLGFHQFWNQIGLVFGEAIGVVQFVSLMCIFANEVDGNFSPKSEKMGLPKHPGMSYLFDTISNLKISYNQLTGNKTALECFNDEEYLAAHGALPLAPTLARTTDERWSGDLWPAGVPTDPNPAVSGFITQADFIKFRGRGLIQTTGRSNYLQLIEFVKGYTGQNSTIDFFQHRWSGKSPGQIASQSTNSDWDTLFQQTDLIVASAGIRLHNTSSGDYLALSPDATILNGTKHGSVHFMALAISGGQAYAAKFKQRVITVLSALPK